ncbi:lysophospholipid acyltransferase family protein [Angustibacter luteus]|uniref:Lysophospholipid acyltransferase family protein n=1 Tax=Angustibacter luteus TaxID=658456 RepID=A0ABW1JH80_9ACTN
MSHRELSGAYRFAAGVLRPVFTAITRRDWRGAEHLPATGGFVVCSNHMSYLDPVTFAHFLYDSGHPPYFLGKEEVFQVPFVGWVLRSADQIPVHRESGDAAAAFTSAVEAVRAGKCLALFPEATLTREPDLWPMLGKTGAARLALTTGCPLVPVAQWGVQEMLMPYAKRVHLLPRKTVHVLAGPPVDLDDLRERPLDADVLAEATERVMHDITALLEQLRGESAPAVRYDPREHGQSRTGNPAKAKEIAAKRARQAGRAAEQAGRAAEQAARRAARAAKDRAAKDRAPGRGGGPQGPDGGTT